MTVVVLILLLSTGLLAMFLQNNEGWMALQFIIMVVGVLLIGTCGMFNM